MPVSSDVPENRNRGTATQLSLHRENPDGAPAIDRAEKGNYRSPHWYKCQNQKPNTSSLNTEILRKKRNWDFTAAFLWLMFTV